MALLLLALLTGTLIFLFYYELIWKKFEQTRGRNLIGLAGDFFFGKRIQAVPASSNSWDNWKYRILVELHRKDRLYPKEAAKLAGVSVQDIELYLDELTAEGKAQSAGDAERGIFYKAANSQVSSPAEARTHLASANFPHALRQSSGQAARGFE